MNVSSLLLVVTASVAGNQSVVMDCEGLVDATAQRQVAITFVSGCRAVAVFGLSKSVFLVKDTTNMDVPRLKTLLHTEGAAQGRELKESFGSMVTLIVQDENCARWSTLADHQYGVYPLAPMGWCTPPSGLPNTSGQNDTEFSRIDFCKSLCLKSSDFSSDRNISIRQTSLVLSTTTVPLERHHSRAGMISTRLLVSVTELVHLVRAQPQALSRNLFTQPFTLEVWGVVIAYKCIVVALLRIARVHHIVNQAMNFIFGSLAGTKRSKGNRFTINLTMSLILLTTTIPVTVYKCCLTSIINRPPTLVSAASEDSLAKTYGADIENWNDFEFSLRNRSGVYLMPERSLPILRTTRVATIGMVRSIMTEAARLTEYVALRPRDAGDISALRPLSLRIFEGQLYRDVLLESLTNPGIIQKAQKAAGLRLPPLTVYTLRPLFVLYVTMCTIAIAYFVIVISCFQYYSIKKQWIRP